MMEVPGEGHIKGAHVSGLVQITVYHAVANNLVPGGFDSLYGQC